MTAQMEYVLTHNTYIQDLAPSRAGSRSQAQEIGRSLLFGFLSPFSGGEGRRQDVIYDGSLCLTIYNKDYSLSIWFSEVCC